MVVPRKKHRVPLDGRMNRGVVKSERMGGACRAIHRCDGSVRCEYRDVHTGLIPEHTCAEDPLQRWECSLSRLTHGVMRRLRSAAPSDVPLIHPELVDYDAEEERILTRWKHTGPDPANPVFTVLDYPNPRALFGDDGRSFLRGVARDMKRANGDRWYTDAEVDAMIRRSPLAEIADTLYRQMNGIEKRKFRQRITQYTLTNEDVGRLAALLPDVPASDRTMVRRRTRRRRRRRSDDGARPSMGDRWCDLR